MNKRWLIIGIMSAVLGLFTVPTVFAAQSKVSPAFASVEKNPNATESAPSHNVLAAGSSNSSYLQPVDSTEL